ncbi:MAG: TatD family hydrolase, partial [Fervidobacterium sp.]
MNEISKNVSMLIDTHAHLHMKHFDNDRTELYDRIRKMKFILNISTSPEDFDEALDVGKALENVYISIGVHPHDALKVSNDFKDYLDKMQSIVKRYRKVIGIGEIGLDYYRNLSPVDVQKKVFAEQLMLANELKLPIVIHIREAHEETYEVLKSIGAEFGGIIHSFSGDELWAKKFVKLGFK